MTQNTRQHRVLGRLSYDDGFERWQGEVAWGGTTVGLTVNGDGNVEDRQLDQVAAALARLDATKVKAFIADELLELYNETWSEEEDPIDAQAFIARIKPSVVELDLEGSARLYFADGGLFHGHTILVSTEEDGALNEAKLAG